MANPDHVALLKKGVSDWNAWREENQETIPDLEEANLRGARLHGANLSVANL